MTLDPELDVLAGTIRTAHSEASRAAGDFIKHALAAGDALILARAKVRHGQWRRWLAENCAVSERSAQRYMRLAKARAANPTRVADVEACSLRGALAIVDATEFAYVTGRPDPFTRKHHDRVPDLFEIVAWWEQ